MRRGCQSGRAGITLDTSSARLRTTNHSHSRSYLWSVPVSSQSNPVCFRGCDRNQSKNSTQKDRPGIEPMIFLLLRQNHCNYSESETVESEDNVTNALQHRRTSTRNLQFGPQGLFFPCTPAWIGASSMCCMHSLSLSLGLYRSGVACSVTVCILQSARRPLRAIQQRAPHFERCQNEFVTESVNLRRKESVERVRLSPGARSLSD